MFRALKFQLVNNSVNGAISFIKNFLPEFFSGRKIYSASYDISSVSFLAKFSVKEGYSLLNPGEVLY
jgi:hypothetical protein